MNSIDIAIRFQVLNERSKVTLSRLLVRVTRVLEQAVTEVLHGEELSELPLPKITQLLTVADSKLKRLAQIPLAEYYAELDALFGVQLSLEEAAWETGRLPASVKGSVFEIPMGIDTSDQGKSVDAFILRWWDKSRGHAFGMIRREAYEGKSNKAILNNIRGTKALGYNDGLMNGIRRGAIMISNTAVQHILTGLRVTVLKESKSTGLLWSAILERGTCARCRGLDLVPFGLDKGPRSPLHINCRCIILPVFKGSKLPRQSYYDWLKDQSEEFVYNVLGKTRGEVFLRGGISSKRFAELQLDRNFNPITIEEFRKISRSAFNRAGV